MELLYYCNPIPDYSTFMEHAPFINIFSISYTKGLRMYSFYLQMDKQYQNIKDLPKFK